jgi:hypothetical protein
MELRSLLREMKNMTKEQIINQNLEELIKSMVDNIGTIDSELRDNLIYLSFIKLINKAYLNDMQVQNILETCLDNNHLFYGIGELNNDSVFTRSFSSLVITIILSKDKDVRFLSEKSVLRAIESSMSYLEQERDTRGYVEGKGWAHSIAHGADLLVSAIRHPNFSTGQFTRCLDTIHNCLFKDATYIDDEDERLIFAIESLIDKKMGEKMLEQWILKIFNDLETIHRNEGFSLNYFRKKMNTMNFLKTLYFRLGFKNIGSNARDLIVHNLKVIHSKLYES